jgi:hypothetical protein
LSISLWWHGEVFFSATERKESFCALIPLGAVYQSTLYLLCLPRLKCTNKNQAMIPLDGQMPFLTTRRSEGLRQLRIFSSPSAQRTVTLFYSPVGKSAPIGLFVRSPLCTWRIRLRDFANPLVERRSLEFPRPENQSTLTLSFLSRNFSCREFNTRDVEQLCLPNPDSRYAETPTHVRVDYSTSRHLCRDFKLHGIMNPNKNASGLLAAKPR